MSRWVVTVAVPQRDGTTYVDTLTFERGGETGLTEREARAVAIEMAARDEAARRYLDGIDCDESALSLECRVLLCREAES